MNTQDILDEQYRAAIELRRPCVQFHPKLFKDGNQWSAPSARTFRTAFAASAIRLRWPCTHSTLHGTSRNPTAK